MSDYNEMWKGLGLDMERHDQLLSALEAIYSDVYMGQKDRPKGMEYLPLR